MITDLSVLNNSNKTMSSLEIAELTGKRHDHVLRDIRETLEAAEINVSEFADVYTDGLNKGKIKQYNLPFYEVCLLLASYPKLRPEVVKGINSQAVRDLITSFDASELSEDQFVYVAMEEHSGRYKIGISKDPESRIKQLNVGNPERLILVHAYLATEHGHLSEKLAHVQFSENRIRGEWFSDVDLKSLPSYSV